MPQKLLQTSAKLTPEQVEVSIRSLKDSSVISANTSNTIIDCAKGDYFRINLTVDTQITLTNASKDGQQIVLAVHQSGLVPHTVTYGNSVRLGTDIFSFPILSQTIDKLDRIIFMYDFYSDSYDLVGYARGY